MTVLVVLKPIAPDTGCATEQKYRQTDGEDPKASQQAVS